MKKRSTIVDVAIRAGVSVGTASKVVNSKSGVSTVTAKKVVQAVKELLYFPSLTARQLKTQESNLTSLHMIVSNTEDIHPSTWNFYFPVIQGFIKEMTANKFTVHLEINGIDDLLDLSLLGKYLKGYNVRGSAFILTTEGDYRNLFRIKRDHLPILIINHKLDASISSVCNNNIEAPYKVTRWLRELGHERIALINGPESDFASIERKRGYIEAIQENTALIFQGNGDIESGERVLRKIRSNGALPTAVFCANDYMAMGVLKACRELNTIVPETISLIGFDDSSMCQVSSPQLASFRLSYIEMGRKAAKTILYHLSSKEPVHKVLPAEIIVRNSVLPLREEKRR